MLSIVINVKNGEKYLGRCLNALTKFADVVVLDNFSTDKTIDIAKSYPNVRFFQCEFLGMGKVRNIAASYAKNDWILFVDADEVLSPELVNKLLTFKFKNGCLYMIKRLNYYNSKFVNSSAWENDWIKRLFNRTETKFIENEVHEGFENSNLKVKKIKDGCIFHFPYDQVSQLIDKMQFYSTLYAKQNFNKKHPKLFLIPFRAFFMFIKCYFLKRGFMDGFEGLAISSYNAIGVFSKYMKLYELYYKRKLALAVSINESIDEVLSIVSLINKQILLPEKVFILIDDNVLQSNSEKIKSILLENLVVPFQIIGEVDQDIITVLNSYLINEPVFNEIVYVYNNDSFKDPKMFKNAKNSILNKYNLPGIQVVSNMNVLV